MLKDWLPIKPIPPEYCWIRYQLDLCGISPGRVAKKAGGSLEAVWYVMNGELSSSVVETAIADLLGYASREDLLAKAATAAKKDISKIIISQSNNPRAPEMRAAENPETKGGSFLSSQFRSGYLDFPSSQGFWSKVPLRLRYVFPNPSQKVEEFEQMCLEGCLQLAGKKKISNEEAYQALWNNPQQVQADQLKTYLTKKYGYRQPCFPQLRDCKIHPILARIFWFYKFRQFSFCSLLSRFEIIITRKKETV